MPKYRKKPIIVDAEPYREGLEDGWQVDYSDSGYYYDTSYGSKQAALNFIACDGGVDKVRNGDEIIYEEPNPYIRTLEGKHFINPTDMIVTGVKGERYPCKKDIFDMTYEEV